MMPKMMMPKNLLRVTKTLLLIDILLAMLCILFFDSSILYNTQIGFISSSLVMGGSLLSYQRMVTTRVKHTIITVDDSKDVIDKIEDPHDLYSEDTPQEKPEDLAQAIKEEKAKQKQNRRSLFEMIRDAKGALSLYRLGGYIFLILGFLYLNRHGLLHIPSYLLSLGLPIVVIVGVLLQTKENKSL